MLESENPIPAFLATDDYVPGAFRDLLSEADGCMQKGFLTGGTACARRALDLLLNVAKQIQGKCLCALGEFSTMAVVTGIERFPQDFKNAVEPSPLPVLEHQGAG